MKLKALFVASLTALVSTPALAVPAPVPGPEAGASLGAMALVVSGYLYLRRRAGR